MKRFVLPAVIVMALISPAISSTVRSDFDDHFDFSKPKTFTWITKDNPDYPLAHPRIIKAIETQLIAKGLKGVETGGDLKVAYHISVGKKTEITDWGYAPGWGGHSIDVYQYTEGTVVVDLINAAADKLVWRGSGTDVVANKPETNE